MNKPKNLDELRVFYCREYRPLYDRFIASQEVPQELHFEVAAAFDHLMRSPLEDGRFRQEDFDRVVGHLKRATFDSFKLAFEHDIAERVGRLSHPRYADVEDGKFQPRIRKMFNEAAVLAQRARSLEHGDTEDYRAWGDAFDAWRKILPIADALMEEENSEKVLRVRNPRLRERLKAWGGNLFWIVVGILISRGFDWMLSCFRH